MPQPKIDMLGKRIGRLTVMRSTVGKWLCRCDCGVEKEVTGNHLRSGRVVSCGCYHAERQREVGVTHGMKRTAAYASWCNMKQRCTNPKRKEWGNYGERGVIVCDAWMSFEAFIADMGQPAPGETLDRIDVNRGYEPGNCRWVTRAIQNRNTRRNRLITIDGVTKPLIDWCEDSGLKYWTVHSRLRRGASNEEALRHA